MRFTRKKITLIKDELGFSSVISHFFPHSPKLMFSLSLLSAAPSYTIRPTVSFFPKTKPARFSSPQSAATGCGPPPHNQQQQAALPPPRAATTSCVSCPKTSSTCCLHRGFGPPHHRVSPPSQKSLVSSPFFSWFTFVSHLIFLINFLASNWNFIKFMSCVDCVLSIFH